MGYDPHVVKMPGVLGAQAREFDRVQTRQWRLGKSSEVSDAQGQ